MKWQLIWFILGILCFVYGIIIFSGASGTRFFLVWIAAGIFFMLLAFAARMHLWGRIPLPVRAVTGALILAVLLFFIFVEAKIIRAFRTAAPEGAGSFDYLLVLGAQVRESGPSRVLRYRLDTAGDYLTAHPDTRCIVSGGQGYNEPFPEAEGMRDYLVSRGISQDRLILESASKNTVENMQLSMALFDPREDQVGIVTNNFHMYRAMLLAKAAGIAHAQAVPAGSSVLFLPNNLLREFFGMVKEYVCGNISVI